jgi:RecB family exonuclease
VRRLRDWSSLLSQVFASCGIPYHVDDVRTLGETAFGYALVRALEGVLRDDPESLLVYLRSPYSGLTLEAVADLELRYRRGNSRGATVLAQLADEMCPGSLGPLWAAVVTRPGPQSLQPDGLEDLCERMLKAAAQHGIVGDRDFEEDARAFRALEGAVSVLRAVGATGPAVPAPESGMVVRALAGVPIPAGRIGTAQAVQVVDVHRARARRFAVVVVMGLCEGEFPGHTDPPALLTRAQRRHLEALAGGGLFKDEANQEAGLFVSAVSRAWQLLLLSARDADDGGGEAVPSRFWSLSRQLLGVGGRQCETRTLAEVVFRAEAAPSPRHYRRACAAEGLSPVLGTGFDGDGDRTRPWRRPPAALTDPAVIAELDKTESFTPSSLETYLSCPFTWFVERVVGVEELEPGLDARSTGQLFHSVLSTTYGELSARGALPVRPEGLADAEAIAHAAIERFVGGDGCRGSAAEKRLTAWQLRRMVDRLLHMESEAGSALLTVETEVTVGDEGGVDIGGIRVRGRIDRIDADPAGASLFVVDYKSGSVPEPSSLGSQKALQLPLYLMALAAERPAAQVVGGAYLSPREERCSGLVRAGSEHLVGPGRQGCRVLDPDAIELVFAEALALSCEAAAGMRAGWIAPHSERECPAWCGLGPVCRSRRGGYWPW